MLFFYSRFSLDAARIVHKYTDREITLKAVRIRITYRITLMRLSNSLRKLVAVVVSFPGYTVFSIFITPMLRPRQTVDHDLPCTPRLDVSSCWAFSQSLPCHILHLTKVLYAVWDSPSS